MALSRALLVVGLLLLVSVSAEETEKGINLKDGDQLGEGQLEAMPDMDDKATRLKLKCGVCKSSVMEMLHGILKKETEEARKLKEIEVLEILESTCRSSINEYGLLLDPEGKPTDIWVNDVQMLKAKGGWVSRLAMDTCNDVYNDFEDYLVENAPKTCKVVGNERKCQAQPLVRHICQFGLRLCPAGSFPEEYDSDDTSVGSGEPAADAEVPPQVSSDAKAEL